MGAEGKRIEETQLHIPFEYKDGTIWAACVCDEYGRTEFHYTQLYSGHVHVCA